MGQAAVKIEPKGEWLSEVQIAKRVGIHRQTLAARLEDLGYEPDAERSNAKSKIHWFDDEMEFSIKAAKDSLSAAKIRDIRASSQLKELKLARERGELVPMHEAIELVQGIIIAIFQELTVRQGKRIDSKLAKAKTAIEVKKIRNSDNQLIMKLLRANFEEFIKK